MTEMDPTLELNDPSRWTDETLRQALVARRPAAWREFHRRFDGLIRERIARTTYRFRKILTSEDAEDIHATVLLELTARDMDKLRRFDAAKGCTLRSWIGMLASHTALDFLRRAARRPRCVPIGGLELGDPEPSPHEHLAVRERLHRVSHALAGLSDRDRSFAQLWLADGRPMDEIASRLSISVNTVYTKKHKIRARLTEALGEQTAA
jgi:RNA polymerase sigma-70 factor (ECF subfamily)